MKTGAAPEPRPPWLKSGLLVILARAAAVLYGLAIRLRNAAYDAGLLPARRVEARVVCVGNLTVGGTGKTPTVIALARALLQAGARVGIVSRGYGGNGSRLGALVCGGDGPLVGADVAGDEPLLISRSVPQAPLYVAADRVAAAEYLVRHYACDLILMDDGFSHRRLFRDLDIILIDAQAGLGNARLLPAGPLREPLSSLRRAGVLILSKGPGDPAVRQTVQELAGQRPIFESKLRLSGLRKLRDNQLLPLETLAGKSVLAFSGLAAPQGFYELIESLGANAIARREYPDHHRYTIRDYEELGALAASGGMAYTLTTSKDAARLDVQALESKGVPQVVALEVEMEFADLPGLLGLALGSLDAQARRIP